MITKPTPEQLARLREVYPKGAPRIDYREMTLVVDRAKATADDARIPIAISSEAPVLRYDWWAEEEYYEVLDHGKKSVDLSYATDGLPFIMSHRSWDGESQHGLVEDVTVDADRVLRGMVRMSRATRSQEIAQDMRDGIRKKISVGYIVGETFDQTEKAKDGTVIRRYAPWMPIETSTVPVPADYEVGVGRALSREGQQALARFLSARPAAALSRADGMSDSWRAQLETLQRRLRQAMI